FEDSCVGVPFCDLGGYKHLSAVMLIVETETITHNRLGGCSHPCVTWLHSGGVFFVHVVLCFDDHALSYPFMFFCPYLNKNLSRPTGFGDLLPSVNPVGRVRSAAGV